MKVLSIILPAKSINKLNLKTNSQRIFNENLKTIEKPIIANLKSYYRNAKEKLNDIYLYRKEHNLSTQTVKYNRDQFEKLPDAIKDVIKPRDISNTGHIDQTYMEDIWESAKAAKKTGVCGKCPRFKGGPEDGVLDTLHTDIIPEVGMPNSLDLIPEAPGLADGLAGGLADNADVVSDIATDAASDLGEHGVGLLKRLIDIFT